MSCPKRFTPHEEAAIRMVYYSAPREARFPRKEIAVVIRKSCSWLDAKARKGGFVRYFRHGREAFYIKGEVDDYFDGLPPRNSTSDPGS